MSGDSAQLRSWWQVDLEHKQTCIIINTIIFAYKYFPTQILPKLWNEDRFHKTNQTKYLEEKIISAQAVPTSSCQI